ILFQHSDGRLMIWLLHGSNLAAVQDVAPSPPDDSNWRVVGSGDFDSDGNPDLLFQHTDGRLALWYLTSGTLREAAFLKPQTVGDPAWRVVGTTDQNGDGKPDLLWQRRGDGTLALWYMNGDTLIFGKLLIPEKPGGTWRLIGR